MHQRSGSGADIGVMAVEGGGDDLRDSVFDKHVLVVVLFVGTGSQSPDDVQNGSGVVFLGFSELLVDHSAGAEAWRHSDGVP